MIWKNEAVSKLKSYAAKKVALENLPMQIQEQAEALSSIRSANPDAVPVRGNVSREDVILNNVVYRKELEESFLQVKRWVAIVDHALGILTPEEKTLLERFFIYAEPKAADRLAGDLCMDVKTIYRRKDDALRKFTIALYGITEI